MANKASNYEYQILGTKTNGETEYVAVNDSGQLMVSVDNISSGVSTEAKQTIANNSLSSIDGKIPTKGQATKSNSMPVTLASDTGILTITVPEQRISSATTTMATVLTSANTIGLEKANRKSMTVFNNSLTTTVYFGFSATSPTLTTLNGFPILPYDSVTIPFVPSSDGVDVYFIASSQTEIRVIQTY